MLTLFWRTPSQTQTSIYEDIWDLIHSLYLDDSELELTGGLWANEAPENTLIPYCIEHVLSENIEQKVGGNEITTLDVVFSLFGDDLDQLKVTRDIWVGAYKSMRSTLRDTEFEDGTIGESWSFLSATRRKDPVKGPGNSEIWVIDITFRGILSKEVNQ